MVCVQEQQMEGVRPNARENRAARLFWPTRSVQTTAVADSDSLSISNKNGPFSD